MKIGMNLRDCTCRSAALAPDAPGRRLIGQFAAARSAQRVADDRLSVLTRREQEVLRLVGHGLSNSEIATELTLSPATARTHVSRSLAKLGARDRAQLVVIAFQTGLVTP